MSFICVGSLAPTNVKATVLTPNSVEVTWDQSSDFTGYFVSCTSTASYAGAKNATLKSNEITSYTLTDLVENTPYDIIVQGVSKDGRKSDDSDKISIITQKAGTYVHIIVLDYVILILHTAPSSPPQDIKVISSDPSSLIVSWQPPLEKNCNGKITGYVIQYARVGSNDKMIMNVSNGTTPTTISGLFAWVEYSVKVAAVNAKGTGPFSDLVQATSGEDSELN